MIYLLAVMEDKNHGNKYIEAKPAGVFYYNVSATPLMRVKHVSKYGIRAVKKVNMTFFKETLLNGRGTGHCRARPWKSDGQTAGTVGRGLRLEALQAKLTGPMAARYNLYYRAHVAYYGWLDWTAGGQTAGTTGLAYPMEAIQVTLREKSQGAPGATAMPSVGAAQVAAGTQVNYRAHVSGIGWQSRIANGRMAGTTGQKRAVEAIDLNLTLSINRTSPRTCRHQ